MDYLQKLKNFITGQPNIVLPIPQQQRLQPQQPAFNFGNILRQGTQNVGNFIQQDFNRSPMMQSINNIRTIAPKAFNLNPEANAGQNFWATPVAQGLANIQQFAAKPPQVKLQQFNQVQNPIGRTAAGIGLGVAENFVNLPQRLALAGTRLGTEVRTGGLKDPRRLIGTAAQIADPLLDVGTLGGLTLAKGIGKQALKEGGKQGLKTIAKRGALEGGGWGAIFGTLNGLAEGQQADFGKGLQGGIAGGVIGAALGGGLGLAGGAAGKAYSKIAGAIKKQQPNLPDSAVKEIAKNYIRDRAGKFAKGEGTFTPAGKDYVVSKNEPFKINHMAIDRELGIDNINPQAGFIKLDAKVGGKKNVANAGFYDKSKFKNAQEFADYYAKNPKEIPTTPEYQKYLSEKEAFVAKEESLYKQMADMRKKFAGKTIEQVPQSEIAKYDNLQKELSNTLSQKTLAKAPETPIKTHIGDKALRQQLEEFHTSRVAQQPIGGITKKGIGIKLKQEAIQEGESPVFSSTQNALSDAGMGLTTAKTKLSGKLKTTPEMPASPNNLMPPSSGEIIPPKPNKVKQVFRTDKFDVTEDEVKVLENMQKKLGLTTRTVRSFDEMKAMAEELGTDPKALLRDVKEGRITDKEVIALGNTISTSSQRIVELTKKLAKAPDDIRLKQELINEETLLNKVVGKRIKGGTEAGRSVAAFRILANKNLEPAYWLDKAKRQIGHDKPLSNEAVTAINDLIAKKDRLGLAHFINNLGESSGLEKAVGLWKASLLTGLRTHEANIVGNTAMGALETLKDIPATAFDIGRAALTGGQRSKAFSLGGALSQLKGAGAGFKRAKEVLKTGIDPKDIAKAELYKPLRFGKTPGGRLAQKATDTVFRTLGAEDKVFYETAFKRSLDEQMRVGKINKSITKGAQPTEEMINTAIKDAEYATFTNNNALNDFLKAGKGATSDGVRTAVDVIAPFTKTPTNVAKATFIDYTPVGALKTTAQKILNKQSVSSKDLADAFGRSATGTGILWLGYELAKKGLVSGSTPTSEAERAQWELENKIPNSVFINGAWRNVARISPVGNLMLLGAEAYKNKGDLTTTAFAGLKGFSENSFLKGLSSGAKAVTEPDRFGSSFIENAVAGYVPTLLGDIAAGMDPMDKRDTEGVKDKIINKIPGLRETLPGKISPLGETYPNERGFIGKTLDPFNTTKPTNDPLVNEFKRVGYNLNYVGDTLADQKLTPEQKREYQKLAGQYIKELVPQVISSEGYADLGKDLQKDIIEKAVNAAKSRAREEIKPKLGIIKDDSGITAYADEVDDATELDNNISLSSGSGKTYTYVTDGKVKTTTLNLDIKPPKLTGDGAFDKLLISRYKSKLTSEKTDIINLYEAKKLTLQEAKDALTKLESKSAGIGGTGKKAKKLSFGALMKGVKPLKLSTVKTTTYKAKSPKKTSSKKFTYKSKPFELKKKKT